MAIPTHAQEPDFVAVNRASGIILAVPIDGTSHHMATAPGVATPVG
jgi:hypothetical protein